MAGSRLELVFGGTPPEGRLLLIGADAQSDLNHFDPARTQIVQRQLQVAPTLTIRPGFPVRIIVTRDLVFEPAGG